MRRVSRFSTVTAMLMASVVLLAGCSFNPSDHAMPGTGVGGDTYPLALEFDSVLSLPAGAEVRSGGTKVGSVTDIDLGPANDVALVRIDVTESVRLPEGTRAELRQTTVLGDIFVALVPPVDADDGPMLLAGDTIGVGDTSSGPPIEQVLERIAAFANGGSMMRVQDSIEELNKVLPQAREEVTDLARQTSRNLEDLSDGVDDLDRIVSSVSSLSAELYEMRDEIGFVFSETAAQRLSRVPTFMTAVLNVVIDVNTLTSGLEWLIPRLPHLNVSLEKAATIMREPSPHATQVYGNAARMRALVEKKIMPFVADPRVDVRKVGIAESGDDATQSGLVLLRMIGAMR